MAVSVAEALGKEGVAAAVVSMPSFELFRAQSEAYCSSVLGEAPRIAVEAGVRQSWNEWLRPGDAFVGLSDFGASAPGPKVYEHFGLTAERVAAEVRTQLVELQGRLKNIQAQGLGLAAISYDSPEILSAFSRQRGITFPLLSDADSTTIKAFGILTPAVEWGLGPDKDDPAVVAQLQKLVSGTGRASENQRGMAIPGTFMVDRRGRVTSRHFEELYFDRTTSERSSAVSPHRV